MSMTLKVMGCAADLRGAQIDRLAGHMVYTGVHECEFRPDNLKGVGIAHVTMDMYGTAWVPDPFRPGYKRPRDGWRPEKRDIEVPSYAYLMNENGKVISQYRSPQTTADWAHACGVKEYKITTPDAEAFRRSQQVKFTPVDGWNPPAWHAGYFRNGDTVKHDGQFWRAVAPYFYASHAPQQNDLWEELFPLSWMTGKGDLPKPGPTMTPVKRSWLCALRARLGKSLPMSLDERTTLIEGVDLYLDEK